MSYSKIREVLEVGTNIAVILAAMTVVTAFAVSFFAGRDAQVPKRNASPQPTKLQAGQVLSPLDGIDYHSAPRTLVIMMSTKCKFCIASVPFYKRIFEEQGKQDKSLHIIAAFPNSQDDVAKFTANNQLPVETVAGLKLDEVGLQYTPTLVLVDDSGKILDVWVGQLTSEGEEKVLSALGITV